MGGLAKESVSFSAREDLCCSHFSASAAHPRGGKTHARMAPAHDQHHNQMTDLPASAGEGIADRSVSGDDCHPNDGRINPQSFIGILGCPQIPECVGCVATGGG